MKKVLDKSSFFCYNIICEKRSEKLTPTLGLQGCENITTGGFIEQVNRTVSCSILFMGELNEEM